MHVCKINWVCCLFCRSRRDKRRHPAAPLLLVYVKLPHTLGDSEATVCRGTVSVRGLLDRRLGVWHRRHVWWLHALQ